MDVVVTHASADFDALAAAVAACKLYPGAVAVMTRGIARGVRDFATLHRDRFPWLTPKDFDPAAVRRLVIVDVRRAERLREIPELLARIEARDPTLEVHVWDHHPASPDDVRADRVFVEPVGSATTLLIEAIRARAIDVDPIEATLFALGIHTDTGSLSYPTTSPRDAEALAWLLGRGASSRVVRRFLTPPISSPQRLALASAIEHVQERRIGGLRIAIAAIELAAHVEGLDAVASELFRIEQPHALFLIAAAPSGRVSVVARSREDALDVAVILAPMGGGGHPSAAAASRGDTTRDAIERELTEQLDAARPRALRVRELMSSPVRTIAPDHPLARLAEELPSWGHTGVPVVKRSDDGASALVGIVSRHDVERAAREGRLHLGAGSCMGHPVRTIAEDATLEDALEQMTKHAVGRLPVLRDGELVGIITRSDVRAVLYS